MAFNLNNKIRTFAENAKTTYESDNGMIKDYALWVSDTDGLRKKGAIPGKGASSIQINTALQQASIGSAILCGAITDTDNPTADVSELSATESKWQSAAIKLAQRLKRPPQITVKSLGSAYTGNILYTGSGSDDDESTLYRTGLEYSPTNNTLILHDTSTSSGTPRLRIGDDAYFMDIDPSGVGKIGLYQYSPRNAEPYTTDVATLIANIEGGATDYRTSSGGNSGIAAEFNNVYSRLNSLGFKQATINITGTDYIQSVSCYQQGMIVALKLRMKSAKQYTGTVATISGVSAPYQEVFLGRVSYMGAVTTYYNDYYWTTSNTIRTSGSSSSDGKNTTSYPYDCVAVVNNHSDHKSIFNVVI